MNAQFSTIHQKTATRSKLYLDFLFGELASMSILYKLRKLLLTYLKYGSQLDLTFSHAASNEAKSSSGRGPFSRSFKFSSICARELAPIITLSLCSFLRKE